MNIKAFHIRSATDEEFIKVNDCLNVMRAETLPDDPPRSLKELKDNWCNLPPMLTVNAWCAWNDDSSLVRGWSVAYYLNTEENQHLVQFEIYVRPECRRQGIGRQLLTRVVEVARQAGRRLMITETQERIPAGAIFMERLGAKMGLATHLNQLLLDDLDRGLLLRWQNRAAERASGFGLGLWEGPYPETELPAVASLQEAMNLAPRGELDIEDQHITPEQIRQFEQNIFARGDERWTMVVREKATGELAGYTEIMWNPNRPDLVMQGATAVWPKYRNKGLGRWLKAAMLEKVLRDRPQVKRVRTGNADTNEAMLSINRELGFKPYQSRLIWQVETDRVLAYGAGANPEALAVAG